MLFLSLLWFLLFFCFCFVIQKKKKIIFSIKKSLFFFFIIGKLSCPLVYSLGPTVSNYTHIFRLSISQRKLFTTTITSIVSFIRNYKRDRLVNSLSLFIAEKRNLLVSYLRKIQVVSTRIKLFLIICLCYFKSYEVEKDKTESLF